MRIYQLYWIENVLIINPFLKSVKVYHAHLTTNKWICIENIAVLSRTLSTFLSVIEKGYKFRQVDKSKLNPNGDTNTDKLFDFISQKWSVLKIFCASSVLSIITVKEWLFVMTFFFF